jgi:parafibromin
MKDNNESRKCLVGCRSHTSEGPTQSDNLDPEILSYFLVRRTFDSQDNEAESTSHQNSKTQNNEPLTASHRRDHSRGLSSARSPKSPRSGKSGDSRGSRRIKGGSIDSSLSASSKYRNITDWSAGVSATSPSSFGPPVRNSVDPPRPAKPGNEWVWFPEGYWAEREAHGYMPLNDVKQRWWNKSPAQKSQISQKSHSSTKPANEYRNTDADANDNKAHPSFVLPQIKIGSVSLKSTTKTSQRTSRRTSESQSRKNNNLWRFTFIKSVKGEDSEFRQQREGLYFRTKRNIEIRLRKRVRVWPI